MSVSLAPIGQTTARSGLPASQAAYAVYQETKVFGSLDGLRAVAILAVLWHHSARPAPGALLATRGFLGVDLFFVISGFLITTLLLRERQRSGAISLRRFYLRRFLRIFPAYYLTLALVAATVLLKRGSASLDTVHDLPYAFFYLSNLVTMTSLLAITWSLSTEEQFYLIVPALEKHLGRRLPLFLGIALVLVLLPALGLFPVLAPPRLLPADDLRANSSGRPAGAHTARTERVRLALAHLATSTLPGARPGGWRSAPASTPAATSRDGLGSPSRWRSRSWSPPA